MKKLLLFLVIINSFVLKAEHNLSLNNIYFEWIECNLDLVKNTTGFTAPVAARSFAHIYTGAHEVLSGDEFGIIREVNLAGIQSRAIVLNELLYRLTKFYFVNAPPYNMKKVDELYLKIHSKVGIPNRDTEKRISNCIQLILNWGKSDGGFEGYLRNFPDFEINYCDSCWIRTPGSFQSALLPAWGKNNPILTSNFKLCDSIQKVEFSIEKGSDFYNESDSIVVLYSNFKDDYEIVAEYWDDSPGLSGSPVGHLFHIAKQLSEDKQLNFDQNLKLFASLGIAVNDAVIESWRLKYKHNLIRPITYIQRYIDPSFSPVLNTPPFPEFPSGHSFQAGAGVQVLIHFFGDEVEFYDNANEHRTDIDGAPRLFTNLSEMAEEMSTSRLYGGIHYPKTLEESLAGGKEIGDNTINELFK